MSEATLRPMREAAGNGMLREVREGLLDEPKELSAKFFYDRRGSELFEEITRLPEYYPTRAEIRILEGPVQEWLGTLGPSSLVEFGAGSGRKTRLILDGMLSSNGEGAGTRGGASSPDASILFVPVDVSAEFLANSARELRRSYARVRIEPVVADMSATDFLRREESGPLVLDRLGRPALFALLGSTIGNFRAPAAVELLSRIAGVMTPEDRFLLGVDLRPGPDKSVGRLERAYNDSAGVTARFNRNVLRVLNRELGTDFDLAAFRHRAFYDEERDRIEMHLQSDRDQTVRLPDGCRISFRAGETVRTEVSHKYDRAAVEALMEGAGMELTRWLRGAEGLYAMAAGRVSG
ncbi:MAG: L-histidine N(alpha)-methyltransferase [Longimicrobiales bacterium]